MTKRFMVEALIGESWLSLLDYPSTEAAERAAAILAERNPEIFRVVVAPDPCPVLPMRPRK